MVWHLCLLFLDVDIRAQLEKQMVSAGSRRETTPIDSTHLEAAGRISQLEDRLERANSTCKDLQNQVRACTHSVVSPVHVYILLRCEAIQFSEQFPFQVGGAYKLWCGHLIPPKARTLCHWKLRGELRHFIHVSIDNCGAILLVCGDRKNSYH